MRAYKNITLREIFALKIDTMLRVSALAEGIKNCS